MSLLIGTTDGIRAQLSKMLNPKYHFFVSPDPLAKNIYDVYINVEYAIIHVIEACAMKVDAIYVFTRILSQHDTEYLKKLFKYTKRNNYIKVVPVSINHQALQITRELVDVYQEYLTGAGYVEFSDIATNAIQCSYHTTSQPKNLIDIKDNIRLISTIKNMKLPDIYIRHNNDMINNIIEYFKFINLCFELYRPGRGKKKITLLHDMLVLDDATMIGIPIDIENICKYVKGKYNMDVHIYYIVPFLSYNIYDTHVSVVKRFSGTVDIISLNIIRIFSSNKRTVCIHAQTGFVLDRIEYATHSLNKGGKLILHEYPLINMAQLQILVLLNTLFKRVLVKISQSIYHSFTISIVCLEFKGKPFEMKICHYADSISTLDTCVDLQRSRHIHNYISHIYKEPLPSSIVPKINKLYKHIADIHKKFIKAPRDKYLEAYEKMCIYRIVNEHILKPYKISAIMLAGGGYNNAINSQAMRPSGTDVELANDGMHSSNTTLSLNRVILIPYADLYPEQKRSVQLNQFIEHMISINNKLPIVVVEQIKPKVFNKGQIYNTGVKWIQKNTNCDVVILHDVDILPNNAMYQQYINKHLDTPMQMIPMTDYFKKKYCNKYMIPVGGGVTAIKISDYIAVNGFPNNFWNWGGEDNAFQRRLKFNHIYYYYNNLGDFTTTDIQRVDTQSKELYITSKSLKNINATTQLKALNTTGLSDLNTSIQSIKKLQTHTHIKIYCHD